MRPFHCSTRVPVSLGHCRTRLTVVGLGTAFALLLGTATVRADDRASVRIRLVTDAIQSARSGAEYGGTLQITAAAAGHIDSIEIVGPGWQMISFELGDRRDLEPGESVQVPFRARVLDAASPLRVAVSFDGQLQSRSFDLRPERLAARGRARPAVRVAAADPPAKASPAADVGDPLGPRGGCTDQLIHFSGRIAYMRPGVDNSNPADGDFDDPGIDNSNPPDGDFDDAGDVPPDVPPALVGADAIWFEIMDDDLIDETMFSGFTNEDGTFDVTICWEDCDITGCDDPDIYLRFECDTGVVNVQDGYDPFEEDYSWSTEQSQYFPDYTGHEIDFGTVMPSDPGQYPAIHIHNTITRAHRLIVENDGSNIAEVDVQWPEDNTEYVRFFQEIYIEAGEQWNEATQTHEWGHHLLYEWTSPGDGDYCNGFCDDGSATCGGQPCVGSGGHCVWCRENDIDAWNEGFPDWLGSAAVRGWQARYGIAPWTQLNGINWDSRYNLETPLNCCDGTLHDPWITEGFVGALLRDLEDPSPEVPGVNPITCPQDSIDLALSDILTVVRQAQPTRVIEFLQSFWTANQDHAHDVRNTALGVAAAYGGLWPTPPIEIYQTTGCDTARVGEPITLQVDANGSTYSLNMRWLLNGVPLSDNGTRTGSFTDTLTISAAAAGDAGSYTLSMSSCDGTQALVSAPIPVFVFGDDGPGYRVTGWGRNAYGSLGRGSYVPDWDVNPIEVNLDNVVDVSAGYWNTVALLADGTVRSWGGAYLGDGTATSSATPVQVSGLSDIVAVSAGGYATCMALDAEGRIWTWGDNGLGQVGDGTSQHRLVPVPLSLPCVVDISMGAFSAAAVGADGTLWTWGYNGYGELGIGSFGGWYNTPQPVPGLTNVVEVECGLSHIIARRSDGSVWCSGSNDYGQLGDGTFTTRNTFAPVPGLSNVISVKAGALHSMAILSDQTPWAWGNNGFGQLGTQELSGNLPNPVQCANPPTVRSLDAGYNNSLLVAADGTIWTCGYWGNGALGRSTNDFAPQPVDLRVGAAVKASAGVDFMMVLAPGARITVPVTDQLAAGCGDTRLRVAAVGQPPLQYQWRKFTGPGYTPLSDGGHISGASSPELCLAPSEVGDTGLYDVVVWNAANFVSGGPVTLVTPPLWQPFDAGQNPAAWWNDERGGWTVTDGVYAAAAPSLSPAAYNSFRLPQKDFAIEFDVVGASSGGVWLRSELGSPEPRGVLLAFHDVYAPAGAADLYWTRWYGWGYQPPEGLALGAFDVGEDIHLRVEVRGDSYAAYLNDSPTPTTQFTTPDFPNGLIGLWDNAAGDTAFDNVLIQTLPNCDPNSGLTPPSIIQRPLSQIAPAGTNVVLDVIANGSEPLVYQWLQNGECLPGASTPIYALIVAPETEGRYECTVSNACGSIGSYPAFVTVAGGPPGDLDGDNDVDLTDLALLLSDFECVSPPAVECVGDADGDGDTDLTDLAILLANFDA